MTKNTSATKAKTAVTKTAATKNTVTKAAAAQGVVKRPLSAEEQAFIQGYAALLAPWGFPPSAGRVYGYLLLQQEPVALDQIAIDLEMSKAGTWSVAKDMAAFGHIRRFSMPGSKRALYAASEDFSIPSVKQAKLLEDMATLMQNCAENVAVGHAATQLIGRANYYSKLRQASESVIAEWQAQHPHTS